MSSIVIAGNTSGAITIAAPAEAGLNTLTLPASTGTVALTSDIPAPVTAVQTHLTTTSSQSITANTRANISGLNATITPSTTSKRIKITIRWNGEYSSTINHDTVFGIKRDTTDIGNPAADGSRSVGMAIVAMGYWSADADSTAESAMYIYIDSPATTSATTYHATLMQRITGTLYNQRTVADSSGAGYERLTSNIILEEID
mgnify:CR=1 FL=1|jgi:hypothetical protein